MCRKLCIFLSSLGHGAKADLLPLKRAAVRSRRERGTNHIIQPSLLARSEARSVSPAARALSLYGPPLEPECSDLSHTTHAWESLFGS